MTELGYFQVGGFRGDITPRDYSGERAIAEQLFGSRSPLRAADSTHGHIELVLGIRPSGASSLLMTIDETHKYERLFRANIRNRPLRPSDFTSLSPIQFETVEDLTKKLASLKTRSGPGGWDTSQANSRYSAAHNVHHTGLGSNAISEGQKRGEYELNRVLYRLAIGALDRAKYSLPSDLKLPPGTRVCILTFTVHNKVFDTRTDTERLEDPKLLDVGFAEANPESFEPKAESIKHFAVYENRNLGNKVPRTDVPGVNPEVLRLDEIGRHVTAFLRQGTGPTLLIVYDKDATQRVLRKLGCQVPQASSIRNVFLPLARQSQAYNDDRNRRDRGPSGRRSRSRSRSPTRNGDPRRRPTAREDDSTTSAGRFVYVDVHALYHSMSTLHPASGMRTLDISGSLGVYQRLSPFDWGASFEAGVLMNCWKAMASGLAIDEQRAILPSLRSSGASTPLHPPQPVEDEYDEYDEDRDPNDDIEEVQAAAVRVEATKAMKSYTQDPDYFTDEEDEY